MLYKLDRVAELEQKVDAQHADTTADITNLNSNFQALHENTKMLAKEVGTDVGLLATAVDLTIQGVQEGFAEIQDDIRLLEEAAIGDFRALVEGQGAITERIDAEVAAITARLDADDVNKARGAAYIAKRQAEQDADIANTLDMFVVLRDETKARLDTDKALIVGLVMKSVRQSRTIKALEARLEILEDAQDAQAPVEGALTLELLDSRIDALAVALNGKKDVALVDSFMSTVSDNSVYTHNRISDVNDRIDGVIAHMNGHITDTNNKFGLVAQGFDNAQEDVNRRFNICREVFEGIQRDIRLLKIGGMHVAQAVQNLVNPSPWGR